MRDGLPQPGADRRLQWGCELESHPLRQGRVAQWPERQAVNLRGLGSTPTLTSNARVTEQADVAGLNPVALGVEVQVLPLAPTTT